VDHVDRGYDRFDHALRTLGADVRRITIDEPGYVGR
jgi:UDP-N-acetylglucosamine enolpyruvyl transferase